MPPAPPPRKVVTVRARNLCVPVRRSYVNQRLSSTACGSRFFGSCGTKRAVMSPERSPLIKARGMKLLHDRYHVDGQLHGDRRAGGVPDRDHDAIAGKAGAFSDEILRELRKAIARSDLLVLLNRLPADQKR